MSPTPRIGSFLRSFQRLLSGRCNLEDRNRLPVEVGGVEYNKLQIQEVPGVDRTFVYFGFEVPAMLTDRSRIDIGFLGQGRTLHRFPRLEDGEDTELGLG